MPDFWQFPTGSMGLGPISAVYNARFMRYMEARGLRKSNDRHVWGVFGDGEMDEPESIGALSLAARERLDNLTFVINCNLQRLDGPVRGNGQIIRELEALFRGAGWNVIKVLWGSDWDALFARDENHALLRRFAATVDGKYQTLGAKDGAYNLHNFFQEDPETAALVSHMSSDDIDRLRRGGHDFRKLFAAFTAAMAHKGAPTVILAKTKKGFGMGAAGESRMTAHQAKKLDVDGLKAYRDRFALPLSDEDVATLQFIKPAADSEEMRYLHRPARVPRRLHARPHPPRRRDQRAKARHVRRLRLARERQGDVVDDGVRASARLASARQAARPRIVPIVADEARTFGMANLFRQIGIYSPDGQLYEPKTRRACSPIARRRTVSFWRRASRKPARSPLDLGRHRLQRTRHGDAAGLFLLLDVRLPSASAISSGRPQTSGRAASSWVPRPAHDPRRRRPAAPGRLEPSRGFDGAQLSRLRPLLCLRGGDHLRSWARAA